MNDFNPYGLGKKVYWNKAATESLIGEVYLWNAKVSTGDNAAKQADLTVAKQHLENVAKNYGLKMLTDFSKVFDAKNKANDEIIFAIRYAEGEASNAVNQYIYNVGTGQTNKNAYLEDGTLFNDPLNIATSSSQQRYEYTKKFFEIFDKKDSRRNATFLPSYNKDSQEILSTGVYRRSRTSASKIQTASVNG